MKPSKSFAEPVSKPDTARCSNDPGPLCNQARFQGLLLDQTAVAGELAPGMSASALLADAAESLPLLESITSTLGPMVRSADGEFLAAGPPPATSGFPLADAQFNAVPLLSPHAGLAATAPAEPLAESLNREPLGSILLSDSTADPTLSTQLTTTNEVPQSGNPLENWQHLDRGPLATVGASWLDGGSEVAPVDDAGQSSASIAHRTVVSSLQAASTAEILALVAQFRTEGHELTDSASLFPWGDESTLGLFGPGEIRQPRVTGPTWTSPGSASDGTATNLRPGDPIDEAWAGPPAGNLVDRASQRDVGCEPIAELTARLLQTAERLEAAALRLATPAAHRPPALRPFRGRVDG
jgi:hypothetical protein